MKLNAYFRYLLIALLAASFTGCSLPIPRADSIKTNTDTVFLRNISLQHQDDSLTYTVWNKVFIEPDRQSRSYEKVLDFSAMDMYVNEHNLSGLKHFDTSMFPDEWVPLYKHREQYFIYSPGDSDSKFALRDSLFIHYFWEPAYFRIDEFKQVSKDHYHLQTKAFSEGVNQPSFEIFVIDRVNNIAVWKQTDNPADPPRYWLLVAKENARKFKLVVNDANEKPDEFEFNPIDFKKLLQRGGFDTSG